MVHTKNFKETLIPPTFTSNSSYDISVREATEG